MTSRKRLQVDGNQDCLPIHDIKSRDLTAKVQFCDDGCEDGQYDQRDLDPVKKEPQHKDQTKQQEQQTPWAKTLLPNK